MNVQDFHQGFSRSSGSQQSPKHRARRDTRQEVDPAKLFYLISAVIFVVTYLVNHAWRFDAPRLPGTPVVSDPAVRNSGNGRYGVASTIKRPELQLGGTKPTIAVVTCATSRNWEHMSFDEMSFVKLMLPSLLETLETDRFKYKLFVGVDTTDKFWNNKKNQLKVRDRAGDKLDVIFHSFPQPWSGIRIPMNEICKAAYKDGADYIVRINDDTEFVSKFWTSLGVSRLLSFDPPNVGVVGPTCYEGKVEILTHDMTHRTHMQIFNSNYYPPDFRNWYVDDWISFVYGRDRTRVLGKWQVRHHIDHHGTRYQAHPADLEGEIEKGRRVLKEWLERRKKSAKR